MRPYFHLLAALLMAGCSGETADTGAATTLPTDTTTTTEPTLSTNPYASWSGWHGMDFAENEVAGEAGSGVWDCSLRWATAGAPIDPLRCEGCVFSFEVAFTFDDWAASVDNGELDWCAGLGVDRAPLSLAFYSDLRGYGPYLAYAYNDAYYGLAAASFSGGELQYSAGWIDDYYRGVYSSYLLSGGATIE